MKILYEDDEIIVVYKEAGLPVQSRSALQMDLESMLLRRLSQGDGSRPELYVVHRIDQPVEGLVLFAKTKEAAADLTCQLTDGRMKKIYKARVEGQVPKEDTLEDYLVRDAGNVTRVVPKPKNPSKGRNAPKKAVLHYRKIDDSELLIELFTGRHHQIRAQLANAGMPIIGDRKYGKPDPSYRGRLMLTAWKLTFVHPKTKKSVTFIAE